VLTIPERVNDVTRVLNVVVAEASGPVIVDNTITPDAVTVTGTCAVPEFLRASGLHVLPGVPRPEEVNGDRDVMAVWLFEGKADEAWPT
jgi:hypothetical protein